MAAENGNRFSEIDRHSTHANLRAQKLFHLEVEYFDKQRRENMQTISNGQLQLRRSLSRLQERREEIAEDKKERRERRKKSKQQTAESTEDSDKEEDRPRSPTPVALRSIWRQQSAVELSRARADADAKADDRKASARSPSPAVPGYARATRRFTSPNIGTTGYHKDKKLANPTSRRLTSPNIRANRADDYTAVQSSARIKPRRLVQSAVERPMMADQDSLRKPSRNGSVSLLQRIVDMDNDKDPPGAASKTARRGSKQNSKARPKPRPWSVSDWTLQEHTRNKSRRFGTIEAPTLSDVQRTDNMRNVYYTEDRKKADEDLARRVSEFLAKPPW